MQSTFVQSSIRTLGASMTGKSLASSASRVNARVAVKTCALFTKSKPAPNTTKVRGFGLSGNATTAHRVASVDFLCVVDNVQLYCDSTLCVTALFAKIVLKQEFTDSCSKPPTLKPLAMF